MGRPRELLIASMIISAYLFFSWRMNAKEETTVSRREGKKIGEKRSNTGGQKPENRKALVKTARGDVTFEELDDKVYKPMGFEITKFYVPVPMVKPIEPMVCKKVFDEWMEIAEKEQPPLPPRRIRPEQMDEFLLNGYASVRWIYRDDRDSPSGEKPRLWQNMTAIMAKSPNRLASYGIAGLSVNHAMSYVGLKGLRGFVVGSMKPWVEAFALHAGAVHVLTVEYNKLDIDPKFRDRMSHIFPVDFAQNWKNYAGTFDFAATFSSIEHSGMGRYGDPIDPSGDLKEMQKIHCMLKPGGLLFLGMPQGTDHITYNLHRIYGPIRLGLMFAGYEWVHTFSGKSSFPIEVDAEAFRTSTGVHVQRTFVLRKI
ncbi:unnamed protein product [Caenorhabditis auriculariae]|uniref:DUF268 domain-containing protein n=1 Tax=Caenorhabditis auriculariae TaxID=2777116 RepID=A0A8S1HR73_9PELO|nr:unnamed protein product [Caenorhabditis auriculariae]